MNTRTRSKRSLYTQEEEPPTAKRVTGTRSLMNFQEVISVADSPVPHPAIKRCFVNLTNIKSPKNNKFATSGNKLTNYFSPVQKNKQPSQLSLQQIEDPESFSQIVLTQATAKDVSGTSNEEVISLMRGVKEALTIYFKDVTNRLQLQSVPPFLYDLKDFHTNYSKPAQIDFSKSESEYMARSFLADDRHFLFINYVRNTILGQREFPGNVVMRGILELIMRIKAEEVKTLGISTQQSITELCSLFNNILMTFPHSSLRSSYLQLFESPFNYSKASRKSKGTAEPGVLHSLLNLLSDLMKRDNSSGTLNQSSSQDNMNNFFLWDKKNEERSSFENFSREEKFERIFVVMELITTLLENDLAVFIVQNSKMPEFIKNNEQCPLIYSILWPQHDRVIGINLLIKNIVAVFVNSIALSYPRNNIQVMARLVNLLSHVINLCEYSSKAEFPCYKSISISLVQEIIETAEKSAYYSIELVTSVAENLRSPLTQMLLVDQVIQKIHNTDLPISLTVPFDLICGKKFLQFKNSLAPKINNLEKYPIIDADKKATRFEVNQRCYLKLLRIYAESVNSYHRIQAALIEVKTQQKEESCTPLDGSKTFNFDNFDEKIKNVNLNEKVKLSEVDLSFKKQIKIKLGEGSLEFYHKEIKHFYLFPKLIKKCHEKFGSKFDDWTSLMKQMEVGV